MCIISDTSFRRHERGPIGGDNFRPLRRYGTVENSVNLIRRQQQRKFFTANECIGYHHQTWFFGERSSPAAIYAFQNGVKYWPLRLARALCCDNVRTHRPQMG